MNWGCSVTVVAESFIITIHSDCNVFFLERLFQGNVFLLLSLTSSYPFKGFWGVKINVICEHMYCWLRTFNIGHYNAL